MKKTDSKNMTAENVTVGTAESAPAEAVVSPAESSPAEASLAESSPRERKLGRKLLAGGLTFVTAAALLLSGLFQSPTEAAYKKEQIAPPAIVALVDETSADVDEPDAEPQVKTEKKRSLRRFFDELLQRVPAVLRTLFALPLWLAATLLARLGGRLLRSVLPPFLLLLAKWLLLAAMLLGILYLLMKLLFPDFRFRELLNVRTLGTLLLGSAARAALSRALEALLDGFARFELLFDLAGGLLLLFAAALPILRKRRVNARHEQAE